MIPQSDMGGLPYGSVLSAGTAAYCMDSFCVPKAVKDPWGLCTALQEDSSLLHGMKRKLMSVVRPVLATFLHCSWAGARSAGHCHCRTRRA